MNHPQKLFLTNNLPVVLGLFLSAISVLFLIKLHIATGLLLLFTAFLFLSYKKVVTIDRDLNTVTICSSLFFVRYNKKSYPIKDGRGKIQLINSTDELFGIDKKSSTYFTYDVLYHLNGQRKINLLTTTNGSHADKTANFLASNLNLVLENKIIER